MNIFISESQLCRLSRDLQCHRGGLTAGYALNLVNTEGYRTYAEYSLRPALSECAGTECIVLSIQSGAVFNFLLPADKTKMQGVYFRLFWYIEI